MNQYNIKTDNQNFNYKGNLNLKQGHTLFILELK